MNENKKLEKIVNEIHCDKHKLTYTFSIYSKERQYYHYHYIFIVSFLFINVSEPIHKFLFSKLMIFPDKTQITISTWKFKYNK